MYKLCSVYNSVMIKRIFDFCKFIVFLFFIILWNINDEIYIYIIRVRVFKEYFMDVVKYN